MGCLPCTEKNQSGRKVQSQIKKQNHQPSTLQTRYSMGTLEKVQFQTSDILPELLKIIKQRLKLNNLPTSERIFRASQHKFKAQAFHQKCHNSKNTIVIAYSDTKRFFGGFTTCPWKKGETLQYEQDQKCSSFIFTLQNNTIDLFELRPQFSSKAIMNDDDYGPIFGEGHDIIIRDQCSQNLSWSNIGLSYTTKYSYGSAKANMELTGKQKYLIREYQVWQVHI